MDRVQKFTFNCHGFQIAVAAGGFLIPGAGGTLKASMIPPMDLNTAAGAHDLSISAGGSPVFQSKVHVCWLNHPKETEPFLSAPIPTRC
jgi:hypothetical protein